MEKLFSETEGFTKHRPTGITAQQSQALYKEIAQEIIENGWSNSSKVDIIKDLSNISFLDSGYEIAKSLEGFYSSAYYEINSDFIEFLEDLCWRKDEVRRKNVETWVKANKPMPKYRKGQCLLVKHDLNRVTRKGLTVYVTGFNESEACYLIDEDKNRAGGSVMAYEKVEERCTPL